MDTLSSLRDSYNMAGHPLVEQCAWLDEWLQFYPWSDEDGQPHSHLLSPTQGTWALAFLFSGSIYQEASNLRTHGFPSLRRKYKLENMFVLLWERNASKGH